MNNYKKYCLILIVFLSFVFPLLASGSREPQEAVTIKVAGLKGPTSVGMLALFDNPPVYSNLVHTEFTVVDEPQIMVARVLSGEVDMAAVPINLASILYNRGVDIKLAAITGNGVIHIVSDDVSVNTLQDLKNKTIYCIAKGSTPEFVLRYVLLENGINPDNDLILDFSYSHTELGAQMASGNVHIGVLPEPFVSIVQLKNSDMNPRIDLQKEFSKVSAYDKEYPTTALIVSASLYKTNKKEIDYFLNDYKESVEWVKNNPKKAGELAEKYIGLPAPVIEKALPRLNLDFSYANDRREELMFFFNLLHSFAPASIGGKVPNEEIFP